jgi:hypothetical protein
MKLKLLPHLLLVCLLAFSCAQESDDDDGGGSSGESYSIQDVNITCAAASASRCDATPNGNKTWIGYRDSDENIVAMAIATLSCDGTNCTATADTWVNASQSNITQIEEGTYSILVGIDVDGDLSTYSEVNNSIESGVDARCVYDSFTLNSSSSSISVTQCQNVP